MTSAPQVPRRWAARPSVLGKYALALLITLGVWALNLPDVDPAAASDLQTAIVWLDLVVGLVALFLLPLRHRFPVALAVVLSLCLAVSAGVTGAWAFAAVSLGKCRRVAPAVLVLVLATGAALAAEAWQPNGEAGDLNPTWWWLIGVLVALAHSLVLAVGFYLGARADLLDSLRERAETAEREQHSRALQARAAERSRIAREMHDVLAHRISTVAMHSGALAYRTDLSPEEVSGATRLIQENAHTALVELRDILGVLREPAEADAASTDAPSSGTAPEPPQPTIADLDTLVADAVAAGQSVSLDLDIDPADVPDPLGRHVYRSVQECLTNARKHAPGTPVDIGVERRGEDLVVTVSNPLPVPEGRDGPNASGLFSALPPRRDPAGVATPQTAPTSGLGLLGLGERADLAGGRLEHGPTGEVYLTRLVVPWPERSPS